MKFIKYLSIFSLVLFFPISFFATVLSAVSSDSSCSQIATIIFSEHLKKSPISSASKSQLQQILNNLYLGYLVRQNGTEVFARSGTDSKNIESYWQSLKNGTASYQTNPFCLYTALKQNPQDIQDNKICIDTASLQQQQVNTVYCQQNLKNMYEACASYGLILKDFLNQIDSKIFKPILGDDGQWQTNYVTFHLQKALARLAATSLITSENMNCQSKFTGDVRDRGMIVNIQNNTDKNFAIIQSTIDNKDAKQIGMLKPGLNNVNLYLAALQAPSATTQIQSAYKLEVVEIGNNLSELERFSVEIMSSAELLAFLKSINKNPKGLLYMNGRLIAPKYAVAPEGKFLVLKKLSKNPTSTMAYDPTAKQSFPVDQRIQVIALTETNPYFLTMQINQDEVEYDATKDAKEKSKATILQPSFFSIQSLPGLDFATQPTKPQENNSNAAQAKAASKQTLTNSLQPIILPDFLGTNDTLNVYTTILQAVYVASLTDFAFFNQKCFASDMMCYNLLGYFDKKNQRRIVLNFYSLYLKPKNLHDLESIIEAAIFQTNINNYNDIPTLYLYIDGDGRLISNELDYVFFNLEIKINNFNKSEELFSNKFFGYLYDVPFKNYLFVKIPENQLKEDVFVYFNKKITGGYQFIFKDKDDVVYSQVSIYSTNLIEKIDVDFLDGNKSWIGTVVPADFLTSQVNNVYKFKINCTIDSLKKQAQLYVSNLTEIDKIKFIHTIHFSVYPIQEFYLNLYNTYEVSSIYHCSVIEDGKMPVFLQSLSKNDWINGIYMITSVNNNNLLSDQHLGMLTLTFYQADKTTKLGELTVQAKNETTGKIGISEPVHAYNIGGRLFGNYYDLFLSTGILLKYKESAIKSE